MDIRPNLFVLGFQKCGTTLVSDILSKHPDIFIPAIKETYFFLDDEKYGRGFEWYLKEYFAPAKASHKWVGEGTPFYACDRAAMERLCADVDVKSARFIIVLRDPVQRAYSAYWHIKRLGMEELSFEEALEAEPARIKTAYDGAERWWRHAYKTVSSYGSHIAMLQEFLPSDSLLILLDADLRDSAQLRARLAAFLSISPNRFEAIEASNRASMPRFRWIQDLIIGRNPLKSLARRLIPRERRSKLAKVVLKANSIEGQYPAMHPDTAQRLRQDLEPEIRKASHLTGLDLSDWLEVSKADS